MGSNTTDLRKEQAKALVNEENILKLVAKDAMIKPILIYEDDDLRRYLKN